MSGSACGGQALETNPRKNGWSIVHPFFLLHAHARQRGAKSLSVRFYADFEAHVAGTNDLRGSWVRLTHDEGHGFGLRIHSLAWSTAAPSKWAAFTNAFWPLATVIGATVVLGLIGKLVAPLAAAK